MPGPADENDPLEPPPAGSPDTREDRSARDAWAALGRGLRPRATRAQALAGVLCALLGFALVAQVANADEVTLGSLRQEDLVRLLDETTTRTDDLEAEAAELEATRDELRSGSTSREAALEAARDSAATQGILTGRLPAVGPGVTVIVTDGGGSVAPVTLLNMLEELRNAGAEAIELNDVRITASSAFVGTAGDVVLDGVSIDSPYRWTAIGVPDTIATALEIPGGALAAVRRDGGRGVVTRHDEVEVVATVDVPDPQFATPAPRASDSP